jgi:hypothetical protein
VRPVSGASEVQTMTVAWVLVLPLKYIRNFALIRGE